MFRPQLVRMLTAHQTKNRTGVGPGYTGVGPGYTVTSDPWPHDAEIDPNTGNIVVAMGLQGSLLGEPGGDWLWIGVSRPSSFGPAPFTTTE